MEKKSNNNLKLAFKDIKKGFSEIEVLGSPFYLKHMSFDDQVEIDSVYDKYYNLAIARGLPTHDQVLMQLIEEKQWTKKQESDIAKYEDFIENLMIQKKAMFLRSEIERINKDIDDAQEKLNSLKNTRASFFTGTAETYAEERVNDFYILKCLYKDNDIKNKAYTEESFEEID